MASTKEQIWLIEYYKCWNATEAARRAGYKWPNKNGPANKVKFADEIKAHIEEIQMGADEVLIRLAEQARGDHSKYMTPIGIDIKALIEDGKAHLIESIKPNQYGKEIRFYNAQSALQLIGKHHGLFGAGADGSEDKPYVVKIIKGVSIDDI